jgi:hypothetical protein
MSRSSWSSPRRWPKRARARTHWSTTSMAAATGMSQTAVSRIWRVYGLRPHLTQTWKLSTYPDSIGKFRAIVGLYLDPPDKALFLAVDEKSQITRPWTASRRACRCCRRPGAG